MKLKALFVLLISAQLLAAVSRGHFQIFFLTIFINIETFGYEIYMDCVKLT